MIAFEINIKNETFRVFPDRLKESSYNVFNHATFHVIERISLGKWEAVEHRFGKEDIPLSEIGAAIERHSAGAFIA